MPAIADRSNHAARGAPADLHRDTPRAAKWFVLYTSPRHEKSVARHLGQREIEFFLTLYQQKKLWSDGSRVTLDLPLFPSYLFVRIQRTERVRVLSVPGTVSIVSGTGSEPAPLPDGTIEALREGLQQQPVEPHPLLTIGQRARIRTGSFCGMEGIVMKLKNGFRVVLTIDQIPQSIAVEVAEEDLEIFPLSASSG